MDAGAQGAPGIALIATIDATKAVVGLELVKNTGRVDDIADKGLVWQARVTRVDFVDRAYLDADGFTSVDLKVGDLVPVGVAPGLRSLLNPAKTGNVAFLLDTIAPSGAASVAAVWHVAFALDRTSGEFLGPGGRSEWAALGRIDPSLQSFDRMLAWVEEPAIHDHTITSRRLLTTFDERGGDPWENTPARSRSLAPGDIPAGKRSSYVRLGLAIRWTNSPPQATLVLRAPSGVVHAAGAGSGDHLAFGNAQPGDTLTLDVCVDPTFEQCTTLGSVATTSKPIIVIDVDAASLRRLDAYSLADRTAAIASLTAELGAQAAAVDTNSIGQPLE